MASAPSEKIRMADSVLAQELEKEMVLLNMATQEFYGLNDVGAEMWKALLATGSVAAAGDRLTARYEIDDAVIRDHLQTLVRDLIAAGLLLEAPSGV